MADAWLNFVVILLVQLFVFIICAFYEKRLSEVPRILGQGAVIGIVFGLSLDLIVGKFLGLSSYVFGFGAFFLILNDALSYGLFAATILLLRQTRLAHFYIWTVGIAAVYEIANYFFRVWTWNLALSPVEFVVVLSIGYFAGAIVVAALSHLFYGYHFNALRTRRSGSVN